MSESCFVEGPADRRHHAVHHAAGGDHVGPGPGVADGLLAEQLKRGVVIDIRPAGLVVHDSAVSVIRVFAEADVGDHEHVRGSLLCGANRLLHDSRVGIGVAAGGVFLRRDSKQQHAAEFQLCCAADLYAQLIDRQLMMPRQRRDRPPNVLSRPHEQWQDHVLGR